MKIQNDNYTHRAEATLSSGATLEILKCEKGYLLRGRKGGYETEIALTHEAMEFVVGVGNQRIQMNKIPTSFVRVGDTRRKCGKCGSSLRRKWLFRVLGCESPACPDYWPNVPVLARKPAPSDSDS